MTGPSSFTKTQTTVPVSLGQVCCLLKKKKSKRMEQMLLQWICTDSFSYEPFQKFIWSLLNNQYTKKGLKQYQYRVTMPVSTHLLSLLHSLSSIKWDCGSVFLQCSRSGVIAVPRLWLQTPRISSPDAAVFKPWLKSTCRREQGLGNDALWAVDKRWWEKERQLKS